MPEVLMDSWAGISSILSSAGTQTVGLNSFIPGAVIQPEVFESFL